MKKLSSFMVALLLAATLAGCTGMQSSIRAQIPDFTHSPAQDSIPQESDEPPNVITLSSKAPSTTKTLTFQQMGKVKNVYPVDGKTVLVVGEKLYLYQPGDGKVLAEAKIADTLQKCIPYENGFLLVRNKMSQGGGGFVSSDSEQYFFELYDKALNKTATLSLSQVNVAAWAGDPQISISKDGKRLCYATLSGLYLYDIAGKKETKLLDLTEPAKKNAGIVTISQPYFANDGKNIAFLAQSFDLPVVQNRTSHPTCGVIGVDGKNLVNSKPSGFSIYEQIGGYNSYALFSQNFNKPDGYLMRMEIPSGKLSYPKTSSTKESGCVFGSDKGGYYVSTYLNKNSWVVRGYQTSTGKQLFEKAIPCTDKVYTYQAPTIRVLDETKTCIVLLGDRQKDADTSVTVFQF